MFTYSSKGGRNTKHWTGSHPFNQGPLTSWDRGLQNMGLDQDCSITECWLLSHMSQQLNHFKRKSDLLLLNTAWSCESQIYSFIGSVQSQADISLICLKPCHTQWETHPETWLTEPEHADLQAWFPSQLAVYNYQDLIPPLDSTHRQPQWNWNLAEMSTCSNLKGTDKF